MSPPPPLAGSPLGQGQGLHHPSVGKVGGSSEKHWGAQKGLRILLSEPRDDRLWILENLGASNAVFSVGGTETKQNKRNRIPVGCHWWLLKPKEKLGGLRKGSI